MISFRLPFPPSVNHIWRSRVVTTRGGMQFVSTYLSAEGKQFRVNVQAIILKRFGFVKPTGARLSLKITATMPDRRVRDISNLIKATEDALTHAGLWKDDSQIDRLTIERGKVEAPGWLDVEIERLSEEPAEQKEMVMT